MIARSTQLIADVIIPVWNTMGLTNLIIMAVSGLKSNVFSFKVKKTALLFILPLDFQFHKKTSKIKIKLLKNILENDVMKLINFVVQIDEIH